MKYILLIFAFVVAASAQAADRIAHPKGSGSTCSRSKPCSLPTALKKAQSGDRIILKNGRYPALRTVRANVTIQAENRRKAIISSTDTRGKEVVAVSIQHSNITVRGLTIDGQKHTKPGLAVTAANVKNINIEDNHIINTGMSGIKVGHGLSWKEMRNIKILGNLVEHTGWKRNGECIYIGLDVKEDGINRTVRDVEIAYNICNGYTHNSVDLKPNTHNCNVHHNIFKNQVFRHKFKSKFKNEGTIVFREKSTNHRIHNNIFRDVTKKQGENNRKQEAVFHIASKSSGSRPHVVEDNVIVNISSTTANAIKPRTEGRGNKRTIVQNNIFCSVVNRHVRNPDGALIRNNPGLNSPLSAKRCDERIAQITREMNGKQNIKPKPAPKAPLPPNDLRVMHP